MNKKIVIIASALLTIWGTCSLSEAEITLAASDLRCEYLNQPENIDVSQPRLSWILESSLRGMSQSAYHILVASSERNLEQDKGDLWDTGKVSSSQQNQIAYAGKPLQSNQSCFWKVRAWDQNGTAGPWSKLACWTTAIMKAEDWKAKWITAAPSPDGSLPLFRRTIEVSKPLRRATVHASGLGQYGLYLDGEQAGDHFLDPAWSAWEKTVYYNTFDLTNNLSAIGKHSFAVMLGKGFYSTKGDRRVHGVNVDRPLKLLLQVHLFYADGTQDILITDSYWRTASGPITHSAILGGEDFDARKEPAGWKLATFDDTQWASATETTGPGGVLTAAIAPSMQKFDVFQSVKIDEPKPGIFVYNFGQNASAIPCLKVRGKAGQRIVLTPAEQRQGMSERRNNGTGLVDQAGVGRPNYYSYICRGDGIEEWSPQFTYTGFQYLQLEGAVPAGRPDPNNLAVVEELTSVHVRTAIPNAGSFECSNSLFNRIDRLIDWAIRSNMAHVFTDCPHREKLGWLEVPYLMGPSVAARYDVSRWYAKIARDCTEAQGTGGKVPTVAPNYPVFEGGFAYSPEWGATAVIVPFQLYQWYDDKTALVSCYPTMKAYVDYMQKTSTNLVPIAGLGDWYDYGHGQSNGPSRFTDPSQSAMSTFYRCTEIVAKAAGILSKIDDQHQYQKLADDIKQAFNMKWFNGTDTYQNNGSPQAAHSMALTLGLVPEQNRAAVLKSLIDDIRSRNNQQTAGDIAHVYLLQTLLENGRNDVIYDMARRTDLGSYGYIVENGWTSMPEAWNADTGASMNHCMLGHIQQWFMGAVAGIRFDLASPGFERIVIAPEPIGNLTWARGRYDSIRGTITSAWKKTENQFELTVTIPANTTAEIRLPKASADSVREGGKPLAEIEPIKIQPQKDSVILEVPSGTYTFTTGIK